MTQTLHYIETITATEPTAYGKDARVCPHCGRVYSADEVPTIEEGCSEDCPQYWELVGKEFTDC